MCTNMLAAGRGWICALALFALPLALASEPAEASQFGVQPGSFTTILTNDHAGEHADLKVTFTLNQEPEGVPAGYLRDIHLPLPPGFVADPAATPTCLVAVVVKENCPAQAAVGVAEVTTVSPPSLEMHKSTVFVYNITPYVDEPAAFAFVASDAPVRLDTSLSVRDGYGLRIDAPDVSDASPLISATIVLWGVPADHNGPLCHINETTKEEECVKYGGAGSGARLPFLSNPVACGSSALHTTLDAASWQGETASPAEAALGPIIECEGLRFEPSISVSPEQTQAREPTGYEVALHMPGDQSPDGRAAADLRSARFALPPGTVISPSATTSLQACSDVQFAVGASTVAACPQASEIGSATITTPLLAEPMKGQLFLGAAECEPCTGLDAQEGRMIRVFVQAAGSGVLIKLAGAISVDQGTGRLTLSISESPQLPVEELKLSLDGGPRALLANSSECALARHGIAQLTPYSSNLATEVSGPSFQATGCGASQFAPSFEAGTVDNQAARSSPAVVSIGRTDQDKSLERFVVRMPPGLLGLLSKVPACAQAAAQAGACGPQSQIGSVTVAAGPGSEPLSLAGAVFLTGPYEGAPFGLSIIVPAQAGPIDLGTIQIRAGVEVNPTTAALTIVSGAVPQSLAGIPLQMRSLKLDINREGFMVNPTNCRPWAIEATLAGAHGASAAAKQHFQAASCAKLPFKPKLTALTNAKATRLGGAYMHIKLTSQPGQANVGKVKLDFPKALPSRLTTLQGACREAVFKADPASCPASSILGTGALTTPFVSSLLSGPVYLVSHGGRAFPDLDAVVQGEGVTLILTGTAAFAGGISSDVFRTLPDAPISTLDLMFPLGPNSAFAANASLCAHKLRMPAELTGQNGAVIKQSTNIAVAGCPRARRPRARHHG